MSKTTIKGEISIELGILQALRALFGAAVTVHMTMAIPAEQDDSGSLVIVRVGDEVIHTETGDWIEVREDT